MVGRCTVLDILLSVSALTFPINSLILVSFSRGLLLIAVLCPRQRSVGSEESIVFTERKAAPGKRCYSEPNHVFVNGTDIHWSVSCREVCAWSFSAVSLLFFGWQLSNILTLRLFFVGHFLSCLCNLDLRIIESLCAPERGCTNLQARMFLAHLFDAECVVCVFQENILRCAFFQQTPDQCHGFRGNGAQVEI